MGWGSGRNGTTAKIAVIPPLLPTLDNTSPEPTEGLSIPHVAYQKRAGDGEQEQDKNVDTGVGTPLPCPSLLLLLLLCYSLLLLVDLS